LRPIDPAIHFARQGGGHSLMDGAPEPLFPRISKMSHFNTFCSCRWGLCRFIVDFWSRKI